MGLHKFPRFSTSCSLVRHEEPRGAPIQKSGPNHIGETDTFYWFTVPIDDIVLDNDDLSLCIDSSGEVLINFISPDALAKIGSPPIPTRGYLTLPGPVDTSEFSGQVTDGVLEFWVRKAAAAAAVEEL